MSKRPTLKEVEKHFENAKEVKCLEDNEAVNISENITRKIHLWSGGYWIDLDQDFYEGGSVYLWDESEGYAEILTYKEKTYSLTADQLRSITDPQVKQWFPEVFETVLEVGKWYFYDKQGECIFFATEVGTDLYAYGKNYSKEWKDNKGWASIKSMDMNYLREATEAEVFEALKNEAVKRGFVEGAWFVDVHINTFINPVKNILYHTDSEDLRCDMGCVFYNGIWAEIIQTKTKAEAEKELNCKIVD